MGQLAMAPGGENERQVRLAKKKPSEPCAPTSVPERQHVDLAPRGRRPVVQEVADSGQQEPPHIRQAITASRSPDTRLAGDQVIGTGDVFSERV